MTRIQLPKGSERYFVDRPRWLRQYADEVSVALGNPPAEPDEDGTVQNAMPIVYHPDEGWVEGDWITDAKVALKVFRAFEPDPNWLRAPPPPEVMRELELLEKVVGGTGTDADEAELLLIERTRRRDLLKKAAPPVKQSAKRRKK